MCNGCMAEWLTPLDNTLQIALPINQISLETQVFKLLCVPYAVLLCGENRGLIGPELLPNTSFRNVDEEVAVAAGGFVHLLHMRGEKGAPPPVIHNDPAFEEGRRILCPARRGPCPGLARDRRDEQRPHEQLPCIPVKGRGRAGRAASPSAARGGAKTWRGCRGVGEEACHRCGAVRTWPVAGRVGVIWHRAGNASVSGADGSGATTQRAGSGSVGNSAMTQCGEGSGSGSGSVGVGAASPCGSTPRVRGSRRSRPMYIDNRASVAHGADHSSGEEDEDSYEAHIHHTIAWRRSRFGIQSPLSSADSHTRLATPPQSDSRAATPTYMLPPAWQPSESDSRAPTPAYMPPPAWQPTESGSRAPTPVYMPPPQRTPLFLPGSRGPTPYSGREFTPMILHGMGRMCEPSLPTSLEPPRKRRRVGSDSDGDDKRDGDDDGDNDGDNDQEQDEETLRRRFLRPDKSIPRRIRKLLDMAAENSDENGEPEEDEDDEATLSDKEFLDDQPQNDNPVRPPSLPEDRDHDNDLALVAYYESTAGNDTEEGELPVEPGTWVRLRRGNPRGKVAFVLTATKLYVVVGNKKFKEKSRPLMKRKDYPSIAPTPDQLVPFAASLHRALLALTFEGPSPALAEGDCVVIVAGKYKGMKGFIAVLREMWNGQKHHRIEYAKVVPPGYGGAYQIKKEDEGAYVELAHLKRAGLNFFYKFLVNDRVQVVSGILYKGATGHVVDVADDRLTISIPNDSDVVGPTTASVVLPNTKLFTIGVGHVSRAWYLGDSVRVRWGKHKDGKGDIVALSVGGILEIFDNDRTKVGLDNQIPGEVAGMFKVRAADVDPDFDSANLTAVTAGSSAYTTTTSVGHLQVVEPVANKLIAKASVLLESEAKLALMKTGLRYEYIQVHVGGKSLHKGCAAWWWGITIAQRTPPDSKKRGGRVRTRGGTKRAFSSPLEKRRRIVEWRTFPSRPFTINWHCLERCPRIKGLFWSNHRRPDRALHAPALRMSRCGLRVLYQKVSSFNLNFEILSLNSSALGASPPLQLLNSRAPPQPEGEITGEWMCIPKLAHKRIDVQVVGVEKLSGRVSQTMLNLEGKYGYLLLAAPVSIIDKKIEVFGVGKHGTKHAIDRTCIKPHREDDLQQHLWEITERLVVLGPDVHSDTRHKGHYAQTIPYLQHTYGPDVVGVKLEEGRPPVLFHMSSLCLAKNIRIQAPHGIFDTTVFL
ncbi:hypothetical protein B0H19DRAFT_1086013 [Mycena capillaripes]|nr:hypothetical protein B0H19DRAFT_1086013 [Mycena capillaripes]